MLKFILFISKCKLRIKSFFSKRKGIPLLSNQKGVAVAEMLPLLVIFVMLFGLIFGFWTSIHAGTLSSIGARHYAFEVLNNRTHFIYHRSEPTYTPEEKGYYKKDGHRFFAVVKFQPGLEPDLKVLQRSINLFDSNPQWTSTVVNDSNKANPIWIKAGYGICIDLECGGR